MIIAEEIDVPQCIRTIGRAQILILLEQHQPTTISHLAELGIAIPRSRKILREFSYAHLVSEKHHLYRLTTKGMKVREKLLDDPMVAAWMERKNLRQNGMTRPSVTRISDD